MIEKWLIRIHNFIIWSFVNYINREECNDDNILLEYIQRVMISLIEFQIVQRLVYDQKKRRKGGTNRMRHAYFLYTKSGHTKRVSASSHSYQNFEFQHRIYMSVEKQLYFLWSLQTLFSSVFHYRVDQTLRDWTNPSERLGCRYYF